MAGWYSTAATSLLFLAACGHGSVDSSTDPGTGTETGSGGSPGTGTGSDPGSGPGSAPPPTAACPLGQPAFTLALGLAGEQQTSDIAIDAAGNVLFATKAAFSGDVDGFIKVSSSGEVLFTRPFGSVVAADLAGNAYVAGTFSAPLDVGLGEMQPFGAMDVFVAKLDETGTTVFARALHLCCGAEGTISSLAVDAAGRIAVSGSLIGTMVLSANGETEFLLKPFGDLAFDSQGDLIIAGSFSVATDFGDGPVTPTSTDGFVLAVDPTGNRLFSHVLEGGAVNVTSVAVDASGTISVAGFTGATVDLFGDTVTANFAEPGRVSGAFAFMLDATGNVIWKQTKVPGSEANGVAIDASGNTLIVGASTGNTGFSRILGGVDYDATGAVVILPPSGGQAVPLPTSDGRYFGVAVDSCGSVYRSAVVIDTPSAASPVRAYLIK